ncbi:UNVERIFIED_CONTAM: hypothetical protein NCL1_46375 [Trichonephila clavipes]
MRNKAHGCQSARVTNRKLRSPNWRVPVSPQKAVPEVPRANNLKRFIPGVSKFPSSEIFVSKISLSPHSERLQSDDFELPVSQRFVEKILRSDSSPKIRPENLGMSSSQEIVSEALLPDAQMSTQQEPRRDVSPPLKQELEKSENPKAIKYGVNIVLLVGTLAGACAMIQAIRKLTR